MALGAGRRARASGARTGHTGVMANVIEAAGLRKRFGAATALDGLDLTVRAGEVHAFLGLNGAGKPNIGK